MNVQPEFIFLHLTVTAYANCSVLLFVAAGNKITSMISQTEINSLFTHTALSSLHLSSYELLSFQACLVLSSNVHTPLWLASFFSNCHYSCTKMLSFLFFPVVAWQLLNLKLQAEAPCYLEVNFTMNDSLSHVCVNWGQTLLSTGHASIQIRKW